MTRLAPTLLAWCVAAPLAAQQAAVAGNPSDLLTADFTVPQSPAFAFLGISPAEVTRPSTIRDLGLALLDVIDTAGRVRQGVALDVVPYKLFRGRTLTVARYQRSALPRLLANTQASVATARASGDSGSTDIGLGLRTVVLDRGDLRRSALFTERVGQLLLDVRPGCTYLEARSDAACAARWRAALELANTRLDSLRRAFRDSLWNAARVELGVGTGWTAPQSRTRRLRPLGVAVWSTGSAPLGHRGQVIAHLEYRRQQLPAAHDALTAGLRLVAGGAAASGFAEAVAIRREAVAGSTDRAVGRLTAGAELQIAPDLWLELGFGSSVGEAGAGARLFSLANLRWGLSKRSRLSPL